LRGFPGGLLTTCGLSNFGPACEENGEFYGLHDRISYTPAREVRAVSRWIDDETCTLTVSGTLRQTRIFGPNLRLERTYTARLGENRLCLRDTLTNDGFTPEAAVILYHCNFGFPLVEAGAMVRLNVISTTPRDANAASGADRWREMDEPTVGIAEKCFFHDTQPGADGHVEAGIWNPRLKLGVNLRYAKSQLPHFTQWKMLGAGTYVCGLEPSNAHLAPRTELRADAALPVLEPGESRVFDLEWSVVHEL